ncbi:hypothetical protein K502DRAFT_62064 [Neoconidiobolus thromboides FSU 785]|nr:hypothetical protein K502DRAFT_62064 [Neoconidiobolus thromboides FSU 785]
MPKYSIDIKTLLNSKRYKLTGRFKFHIIYQLVLKLNLIHQYDIVHNDLSEVNVLLTKSLIELLNIREENEENINDIKKHLNPYNLKDIKEYEPIIIDFGKSMSLNMNFIKNIQVKRHSLINKDDLIHLPLIKLCKPEHGFVLYRSILTIPIHHKQEFIQPIKLYDPKKEDIYSLGILIFRILTNLSPWGGVLEKQLKQIREIIEDPIEQYKHLKRDLKDNNCWLELLCFLLHPKPELRWNSREIVKYLKVNAKKLLEECIMLSKARTKKRM